MKQQAVKQQVVKSMNFIVRKNDENLNVIHQYLENGKSEYLSFSATPGTNCIWNLSIHFTDSNKELSIAILDMPDITNKKFEIFLTSCNLSRQNEISMMRYKHSDIMTISTFSSLEDILLPNKK